jgi:hypothetical protein
VELCPLIEKKITKIGGFWRGLGFRVFGKKKWKIGWIMAAGGGCGWCRRAGGGVLMVGEVMAGGGFWILGRFGEDLWLGCDGGRDECVRLLGKNGGEGKKGDLKIGHARPKTEYVRKYISTFDRTRAGCMGVK